MRCSVGGVIKNPYLVIALLDETDLVAAEFVGQHVVERALDRVRGAGFDPQLGQSFDEMRSHVVAEELRDHAVKRLSPDEPLQSNVGGRLDG